MTTFLGVAIGTFVYLVTGAVLNLELRWVAGKPTERLSLGSLDDAKDEVLMWIILVVPPVGVIAILFEYLAKVGKWVAPAILWALSWLVCFVEYQ